MPRLSFALALTSVLAACAPQVQMTSGTDYLARYSHDALERPSDPASRTEAAPSGSEATTAEPRIDPLVRAAAAVEPDLRLPARFGLARIVNGRLTAIPKREADLWQVLAMRHRAFGEFVPISPLLAVFTAELVTSGRERPEQRRIEEEIVQTIRLGAARQHVDAVLIYEVGARASRESTWLALADLTVIGGAFLPTRSVSVSGQATALLLDVRNGYPYGTASAEADLSELHPSWGAQRRTYEMQQEATFNVVANLVPEVETMMTDLATELLKRQAR